MAKSGFSVTSCEDGTLLVEGKPLWDTSLDKFSTLDMDDCALDELCQINKHLLNLLSDSYHESDNIKAGYITIVCDRYMAEIKNRILYTAI
jgi:hypothetical protein